MNPYREEKIFDIVKKLRLAEKEITDNASIDVMDLHFITGILFCHSSLEKGKNLRLSHLAPISFKKADAKRIREAFEECGFRNHIVIHTTLTHADITVITDILRYYNRKKISASLVEKFIKQCKEGKIVFYMENNSYSFN